MAESRRIRCHGSEEEEEEAGENENGRRRDGSDLEEVGKAIKNWRVRDIRVFRHFIPKEKKLFVALGRRESKSENTDFEILATFFLFLI